MRAVGEAGSLGELQETHVRAVRETLPSGLYLGVELRRVWMRVEHYLAENPEASTASACVRLGIARETYEEARRGMVHGKGNPRR